MTLFEKYNEDGRLDCEDVIEAVIESVCIKDCECLKGHYDVKASESICSKSDIAEETCKKCWNLEYIEDYVIDTNVGNKNSKKESDKMGRVYQYNGKEFGVLRIAGIKNPCLCKVQGKATEVLAKFVDEEAGFEFLREVDDLIRAYHEYIKTEEEYESDTYTNEKTV